MKTYNFEKTITAHFVKNGDIVDTYVETNMYTDDKEINLTYCNKCGSEFISTTFGNFDLCPACGIKLLQPAGSKELTKKIIKINLTKKEASDLLNYVIEAIGSAKRPEDLRRLKEIKCYLFEVKAANKDNAEGKYFFRYSEIELLARYVDESTFSPTIYYIIDNLFEKEV